MTAIARHHAEWLGLIEVSGPFLTLPVLERVFPQGLDPVEPELVARLRDARDEWVELQEGEGNWIAFVLREVLGFDRESLKEGAAIPTDLQAELKEHHETVKPNYVIVNPAGKANAGKARLLVMVWPREQDLDGMVEGSAWAASPAERMTVLCRATGVRLGLVTNGQRWILVDAPQGETAGYASWYSHLWLEERLTLRAFRSLLGVRRFFAVAETDTVEQMLHESFAYQEEVTGQLGYQVRRAVEVLVQALDRADLDRDRKLLEGVTPEKLYEAGLTVMMRLVFLFCAEERGLLLLGDSTYDDFYAVSTLRGLLREEADRVGLEVLERRQDAWTRLLASFRAVYGGLEHDTLRLPALGGSLFDPDRFPFLEGRAQGSSWIDTPAVPLPIDNRTVLYLLEALQLLQMKGSSGSKEARRLSFRALDVEQIGYVYEGLLDHVAVRVPGPTLGLIGTKDKEPEVLLSDLEEERKKGQDALVEYLKEQTGRSASALKKGIETEAEEETKDHLLVACGNDRKLMGQILPYHGLLRDDVWGYPQVYRSGSFMVTGGPERRETGTHYTPKSLTEKIVTTTLEPLVYDGPANGKPREAWKLRKPAELLDLKICDPAMGSGAFLVQACRWLAERVVETWDSEEKNGSAVSIEGEILGEVKGRELLPKKRDERITIARRLIAERCLYGVDINPLSSELAKLSIWLVTFAKDRPFGFLDHNLRNGDSLLGISSLDQLINLAINPEIGSSQRRLFGQAIKTAVEKAVALRQRLRELPIRDIQDVVAMSRLNADAVHILDGPELIAHAFIAAVYSAESASTLEKRLIEIGVLAEQALNGDIDGKNKLVTQVARTLLDQRGHGRTSLKPFQWPLEFPEVFLSESSGFHAIVGNPPFLGGKRLTTVLGEAYMLGVKKIVSDKKGAADLCAYFFLKAGMLLKKGGLLGMIATNSISQGATREIGLAQLNERHNSIVAAWPDLAWPGTAGVTISPCILFNGKWNGTFVLSDRRVEGISSYLEEETTDDEPYQLKRNEGIASIGTYVNGSGFIIDVTLSEEFINADSKSKEIIQPYLTAQDINQSETASPSRYIINFNDMPLEVAKRYRLPFAHVVTTVKPQRDKLTRQIHEECFWKHWDRREAIYERIRKMQRVIVAGRVSKHHVFSFADPSWLISDGVVIFLRADYAFFGVLQSSIHNEWVQRYKTTMRLDTNYSVSRCFLTYPLPEASDNEVMRNLILSGEAYYKIRCEIAGKNKDGLTSIYNKFHDYDDKSDDIASLRSSQKEMDYAVIKAYGWNSINLEHGFHETKRGLRYSVSDKARKQILRKLVQLNHERYEEEQRQGLHEELKAKKGKLRFNKKSSSIASDTLDLPLAAEDTRDAGALSSDHVREYGSVEDSVIAWLRQHAGWNSKEEVVSGLDMDPSLWTQTIRALVEKGLIDKMGERRAARYRYKG